MFREIDASMNLKKKPNQTEEARFRELMYVGINKKSHSRTVRSFFIH